MKDQNWGEELVLRAMLTIANADQRLVATETETIRRIYRQMTGTTLSAMDVVRALDEHATEPDHLIDELEERSDEIDSATKDTLLRASYLVLMADKRIAAGERKWLHAIAAALDISEPRMNALLEGLSPPPE